MIRIFFLLLLGSKILFSADLNQTIVDGNTTLYKQFMQKLSQENNKSDDSLLQYTILNELIHDSDTKKITITTSVKNAKTQDEYKKLFSKYLQDLIKIQLITTKLKNIDRNIETIENEINALDVKSQSLLTNELQDAFYHKKKNLLHSSFNNIQKELQVLETSMQLSLQNIVISKDTINHTITQILKPLSSYQNKINQISITIEQAELLNKEKTLKILNDRLSHLEQQHHKLAINLIINKFLLFSTYLQEKNTNIFALQKEILQDIHKYKIIDKKFIDEYFSPFLLSLETKFMGRIKTIAGSSQQEAQAVIHSIWQMLQVPLFHINTTSISVIKLVITFIIFILGLIAGRIYKKNMQNIAQRSRTITTNTLTLLSNLGYYTIFLITFFIVLKFLGIDLSSIALVAGALSVGIGFGLQNIISNFVSGIILMVERSIKIGDYIQLDETLRGRVIDIKMRSITIVTNSNIDIVVPNLDLIQQKVINWTMNDKIRRFEIPFGVAYGSDAKKVVSVILQAVNESKFEDIYQDKNKITRVIMTEMADSSVNFELFVWIKGADTLYPKRTISKFLILIYETLNKNKIEIPFPQQDLHIKSVQTNIPIIIQKSEKG